MACQDGGFELLEIPVVLSEPGQQVELSIVFPLLVTEAARAAACEEVMRRFCERTGFGECAALTAALHQKIEALLEEHSTKALANC